MRSRTAPPTASARGGSVASAGKRRSSSSRNMVAKRADPLDLHFHRVTLLQRADAGRRTGEDHVAGFQRHHRSDELEKYAAGKQHDAGAAVLPHIAVDARAEREIGRIELRFDARADGAERVEALAARELHILLLQIAGSDIIGARKSEDIVAPAICLHGAGT